MATLKDVAEKASVNVSTVSRALNNTSYVHPDTKAKIIAAAKELGYSPNLIAQALRRGKRNTLGLILPWINSPTFSEMVQGFVSSARRQGYEVLICTTNDDPKSESECLMRLRGGIVDGIAIASHNQNRRNLIDLIAGGLPVIQLLHCAERSVSSIEVDAYSGGLECVKHLYSLGCRRIALLQGQSDVATFTGFYQGYRSGIRQLGLKEYMSQPVELPLISYEYAYEATQMLMDQPEPPDAIIGSVEIYGKAILHALTSRGISARDQVRVACLSGQSPLTWHPAPIIPLEAPNMSIGEKAAEALISDIRAMTEGKKPQPMHISFPEWIDTSDRLRP